MNYPSALTLSNNGQYLYITNRGLNNVAVFSVDKSTGKITYKNDVATGDWPRELNMTKDNKYLAVANQKSNSINIYNISDDQSTLTNIKSLEINGIKDASTVVFVE